MFKILQQIIMNKYIINIINFYRDKDENGINMKRKIEQQRNICLIIAQLGFVFFVGKLSKGKKFLKIC